MWPQYFLLPVATACDRAHLQTDMWGAESCADSPFRRIGSTPPLRLPSKAALILRAYIAYLVVARWQEEEMKPPTAVGGELHAGKSVCSVSSPAQPQAGSIPGFSATERLPQKSGRSCAGVLPSSLG